MTPPLKPQWIDTGTHTFELAGQETGDTASDHAMRQLTTTAAAASTTIITMTTAMSTTMSYYYYRSTIAIMPSAIAAVSHNTVALSDSIGFHYILLC